MSLLLAALLVLGLAGGGTAWASPAKARLADGGSKKGGLAQKGGNLPEAKGKGSTVRKATPPVAKGGQAAKPAARKASRPVASRTAKPVANRVARPVADQGSNPGRRAGTRGKKVVSPGATARRNTVAAAVVATTVATARPSIGQVIGLHEVYDPLSLHSAVALAVDAGTGEVLFEKNARAVLPIASISKLMTALVVLEAGQPLDERLRISEADIDTEKFTTSRLRPGTVLTRDEMLQLALMASENRAANALGRHFPGGLAAFVARMNEKARELGMTSTWFVEPTGLSSRNVSSAVDLAGLVRAASQHPLIKEYSTALSLTVEAGGARPVSFRNTNRLVARDDWDIGLQKTGYISEAGNCLVMQARVEGRPVVLVLLDANGKLSRFGDARRLRDWIEEGQPRSTGVPHAAAQSSRGS